MPDIREEVKDTYGNKIWRMQNLYHIRDKKRRLAPLKFNAVQRQILADILPDIKAKKPVRHFTLKSRQQGVSTFWMLWWLDDTITRKNTITGVLAHKLDNIKMIMNIVRMAYNKLPERWRPALGDDNKNRMSFPSLNSELFSGLSVRSTAVHNLHISEWCFCADEEVQATLAASSEQTNVSGETTGNGVGNDGYATYQQAKQEEGDYKARFFPWFTQEEYKSDLGGAPLTPPPNGKERELIRQAEQEYGIAISPEQIAWKRKMSLRLKGLFQQEYPESDEDAFRTSGTKFFDYKKIHRLILKAKDHLKKVPPYAETDDYIQFEKPIKGDIYAAGADTSEGGGGDFSVLKIINVTKRQEAFVFRARCGVDTFYRTCDEWGRIYNNAFLGVERNNHGHAVLMGLNDTCGYPNLFKEIVGKDGIQGDKFPREKLGWLTTSGNRPMMLDALKFGMEGESDDDEDHFSPEFDVWDVQLLKECLTFEDSDGKFQAAPGEHDDDVMGSAIAYQMYALTKRLTIKSEGWKDRIQIGGKREAF